MNTMETGRKPESADFAKYYGLVYVRMLAIAVPVAWIIAMATSMSFLRANTIEGMVTGLTTSIVIAQIALTLVVIVAVVHWKMFAPPRDEVVTTTANALLLILWAMTMVLQHAIGANLFYWRLFEIDEPYPLFNPDIDAGWHRAFFVAITSTLLMVVGRRAVHIPALLWLVLTAISAGFWLILTVLYANTNDLINYRISIACHEGTTPWWMEGREGGTILIVIVALVGFFRIRSAWLALRSG